MRRDGASTIQVPREGDGVAVSPKSLATVAPNGTEGSPTGCSTRPSRDATERDTRTFDTQERLIDGTPSPCKSKQ